MNNFIQQLEIFGGSDIPEYRLFYFNTMKQWIEIGKRIDRMKPTQKTTETIEILEEQIKDYKLYPKLGKKEEITKQAPLLG